MTRQPYDAIGAQYSSRRREDPRLARVVLHALGNARSVINVGAGTGSYEPRDRDVVAVEPAITMIRQRPEGAAPVVRAVAEALPFRDDAAAAALAILTLHHWSDREAGLAELCRVAEERVVIWTWDPTSFGFWLTRDYFPEFVTRDRLRCPTIDWLEARLLDTAVIAVPILHDCQDGFLGAFWRRPAAYLDATVRAGISSFAQASDLSALERLEDDLASGAWERKHGEVLAHEQLDLGYRIVVGRPRKRGRAGPG